MSMVDKIDYYAGIFEKELKKCDDRTVKILLTCLYHNNESLFLGLEGCESPIEKMMLIGLEQYADDFRHLSDGPFTIENQVEVECDGKKYRVDIAIYIEINGKAISVAIECDGHEFHEKTKIQAARDKQRERAITLAGFTVMRFAGSEIWKDPFYCAGEVWKYVLSLSR